MARLFVKMGGYFEVEINGEADEIIKLARSTGVVTAMKGWAGPYNSEDDAGGIDSETGEPKVGEAIKVDRITIYD